MNTLQYILDTYKLGTGRATSYPIEIPNTDRETLAHLFNELRFINGAEIGVERGIYSEMICQHNLQLHALYCVDYWTVYKGYRDHTHQETMYAIYQEAKKRLAPYPCKLIAKTSDEAVQDFPDGSLDFVYIDANHEFQHVVNDICNWSRKVRPGGIVAGHDFIRRKGNGYLMHVEPAVFGFTEAYAIRPWFVLGSKEARPGEKRDHPRSWFYVKPEETPIRAGHDGD